MPVQASKRLPPVDKPREQERFARDHMASIRGPRLERHEPWGRRRVPGHSKAKRPDRNKELAGASQNDVDAQGDISPPSTWPTLLRQHPIDQPLQITLQSSRLRIEPFETTGSHSLVLYSSSDGFGSFSCQTTPWGTPLEVSEPGNTPTWVVPIIPLAKPVCHRPDPFSDEIYGSQLPKLSRP